jgi:GNAT superfamily N-acetyltransferase
MADAVFRPLQPEEFDQAHGVLVSAAGWLMSKGIRQWTTAYPKELYRAHQEKGWNYGLFIDGDLAVIVTLAYEPTNTWTQCIGTEPAWWMSKLATAPKYHGRGLGARAVREACRLLSSKGAQRLYLDCVHGSGVLVSFYEQAGFSGTDRRPLQFSTGEFDMVLMSAAL